MVIAIGSIVLFFSTAAILVRGRAAIPVKIIDTDSPTALSPVPTVSASAANADSIPKTEVVLNKFHRSEVKDGKKLWEVEALQGRYLAESASIDLDQAKLWVYQKSGETVSLDASKARLFLEGQELVRAETSGGVRVDRDGKITVTTEAATYVRRENIVQAPGFVQIKSDTVDVSGTGLEVQLDTKEIRLSSGVSSIVQPMNQKQPAAVGGESE